MCFTRSRAQTKIASEAARQGLAANGVLTTLVREDSVAD
jgi:hypothetical protein